MSQPEMLAQLWRGLLTAAERPGQGKISGFGVYMYIVLAMFILIFGGLVKLLLFSLSFI